ncbi:MAG TPA: hypothetical protein VN612_15655 [Acidobacteriaceae bacterium]|nr:hypothetical protein [Acidobacteriaceae bacterium]
MLDEWRRLVLEKSKSGPLGAMHLAQRDRKNWKLWNSLSFRHFAYQCQGKSRVPDKGMTSIHRAFIEAGEPAPL